MYVLLCFCTQEVRVASTVSRLGEESSSHQPSHLAQSPAPQPGCLAQLRGILQPGAHSQPAHGSRYRELPPDTASAPLQGCSAGHTSSGNTRAQEPELVRPIPRWPGWPCSQARPSSAPPQIPRAMPKGFFHLPPSLSNQLWLERQRLHYITF